MPKVERGEPESELGADTAGPHLLFDLGDVLIAVDRPRMLAALAELAGRTTAEVEQAVFGSGLKAAFDVGRIGACRFWREACQNLGREIGYLAFARAWCGMFTPIEPTLGLLAGLRGRGHRCFLLTNTDPLHFCSIRRRWPAVGQVDGVAASCTLGLAKPDPRFFQEALRRLGLSGQEPRCILIDDTPGNVAAAQQLGLQAVLATSPEAVRRGLTRLGVELPGEG